MCIFPTANHTIVIVLLLSSSFKSEDINPTLTIVYHFSVFITFIVITESKCVLVNPISIPFHGTFNLSILSIFGSYLSCG